MKKEQHITVQRTARYYTLGEPSGRIDQLWFVCHGYGQLAAAFIDEFSSIAADDLLVVAPEGLSLFYTDHKHRLCGASWMTRENREQEIEDYLRFLQTVYKTVTAKLSADPKITVLGFSQGAATAARLLNLHTIRADRLILWAAPVSPDIDISGLKKQDVLLISGKKDRIVPADKMSAERDRLAGAGIACRLVRYDGAHRIDRKTLKDLCENNL